MTAIVAFVMQNWRVFAILGLVAALVGWHYTDRAIAVHNAVTKAVAERDDVWKKSEQDAIAKARAEAAAKDAEQAKAFAALKDDYEKEKDRADKADSARLAAVRAGARLRIPAGCSSAANVSSPAAAAAGSNDSPAAQFLGEADSAFLVGEAARADEVVRQLTLCQATLTRERK